MADRTLNIGIVGAGVGGLAAASLLARHGHRVTVAERAPKVSPVGAGLLIQPTGRAVLDTIGVGDRVASLAHPVDSLIGTTPGGRRVLALDYDRLRHGLHGLGVHRAALHAALLDAARDAGATILTDRPVSGIGRSAHIRFLKTPRERLGPFDLIVIADGARSALRGEAGPVRFAEPYTWGALWAVVHGVEPPWPGVLRQVYDGTKTMLGFLPSGRTGPDEPDTLSVFWSMRCADWHGPDAFDFAGWQRRVRALAPETSGVFDRIGSASELVFAPYFDVKVTQRDHTVVVIGDAAHATSPQLGQGANLALLDALALARSIEEHPKLAGAIPAFAGERRSQVGYYRWVSRWLTPAFQSRITPIGWARDLGLPVACSLPPTRRLMLTTLAGVRRGLLRGDPLPGARE